MEYYLQSIRYYIGRLLASIPIEVIVFVLIVIVIMSLIVKVTRYILRRIRILIAGLRWRRFRKKEKARIQEVYRKAYEERTGKSSS